VSVAAQRKPRGFTLIEVGVAATLAAVVMGGATALLVGMMRTNNAVRERLEQIAVRNHLASVFRADVAGAKSCMLLDAKQPESGILLRTDDEHRVRYVAGENDVQRIAETGDKVTARDTFYLGDRQRATLTMTSDSLRLVRCTIEQPATLPEPQRRLAGMKPRAALIIAAVLGRSDRLNETLRKAVARPKAAPEPPPDSDPDPPTESPEP
jgi:prepilin-type N-terminal cleavage/methylation domain-containing protein